MIYTILDQQLFYGLQKLWEVFLIFGNTGDVHWANAQYGLSTGTGEFKKKTVCPEAKQKGTVWELGTHLAIAYNTKNHSGDTSDGH